MITLYTRDEYTFCESAKRILSASQIEYTEKMVGTDITREEILEQYPNQTKLPVALSDGELIGNYHDLLIWIARQKATEETATA